MDPNLWLAFAAASLAMALIPGPGVISIVGFAMSSGRTTALASVGGMAIGNILAMSLSLGGVGAVLAASALAFTILKWAGAFYLIGLGSFAIARSNAVALTEIQRVPVSPNVAFISNLGVGTFHPKTIVFFIAFAPQFISPAHSYSVQAGILVATFTLIAAITDTLYALAASRASAAIRAPRAQMWSKRIGGGIMVTAGAAMALSRR